MHLRLSLRWFMVDYVNDDHIGFSSTNYIIILRRYLLSDNHFNLLNVEYFCKHISKNVKRNGVYVCI